jgi:uncharacterized protein (DUF1778 family)
MMNEEEQRMAKDLLARLSGDLKETLEEAAKIDGLSLEEYLLVLIRDMDQQGLLEAVTESDVTESEFLRLVFVGDCPACGSEKTVSGDELEDVDDPTVGICQDCGFSWCLECGATVARGEICGHWGVCETCDEEKDEFEDCGIEPSECPKVVEWMGRVIAEACKSTCSWCGLDIPEEKEVFAVGATLRGAIEFTSDQSSMSFFMPVAIGGKVVPAVVTASDSEARQQGNDLMFMTCSEACAEQLRDALREEKELIDRAELN